MKKVVLSLMVLVLLVSAFVGCAPKQTEEPQEPEKSETPAATEEPTEEPAPEEPAGPIVFDWNIGAEPKTIDPGLNGASDGGDVINNTFEGLIREKSGQVLPGIAETWDVSEDGLTVTFHLRESNWSDGSPLTANDFEYAWKRNMAPETASEYSWLWKYTHVLNADNYVKSAGAKAVVEAGVGGAKDPEDPDAGVYTQEDVDAAAEIADITADDVGVKALDEYTLEVKLESPTGYFVSLMSFYHFMPLKKDAVEATGGEEGIWATKPDLAVSNGPFVLTGYNIGEGLTLEKNANYWNVETVGIDVINGDFVDDTNTAYNAYTSGDILFTKKIPTAEIPRLIAEDPTFYQFPLLGTYYMNFNLERDVWEDSKVRRAISMVVDRQLICDTLAAGQVPAGGFIPPGFQDNEGRDFFETAGMYGLAVTPDEATIAAAQELLAEAGYPNGEGFPEFTIAYNTDEGHQTVAEMIQQMVKDNLGIVCKVENQEWAVFQDNRIHGNYDMARGGWLTDFMDPIGMLGIFLPGTPYNTPRYNSEEFIDLIDAASAAATQAEHFDLLYKAQEVFMNDSPIIPIYHYSDTYMASDKLVGWDRSVLGSLDFSTATVVE